MSHERIAAISAALVAALAVGITTALGDSKTAPAATGEAVSTARVERRDLVERETISGTFGHTGAATVNAGVAGTLTRLRRAGTVVRRGGWLYEADGRRTGWVLYGDRPAWRDYVAGMTDGADVRQLEVNLRALGHDPDRAMKADGHWDRATTAAVRRFQADRNLSQDGALDAGEIVFRPGAVRLGEAKAAAGDQLHPGAPLLAVTGTGREVTVDVDADRQTLARRGAKVTVTLPGGRMVLGRVTEIGTVARTSGEGDRTTISVRVRLLGRASRHSGYDQAPVDVGFERRRAKAALAVPVTALVARAGGGYAVEVAEQGQRRLVPVSVGVSADGLISVVGDLRAGQLVVVPS